MLNLLKKLINVAEEKRLEVDEQYHGLVTAAADENEGDPEAAMQIMQAAGKTIDDLEADVKMLLQRREWAKTIQQADQHAAKSEKAEQKVRKLLEKRKELVDPINAEISELQTVIHENQQHQISAQSARRRLQETVPDFVKRKQEELTKIVREKMERHKRAIGNREATEAALGRSESKLTHSGHQLRHTSERRAAEEEIQAIRKRLEERRRQEREAAQEVKKANDARDDVILPLILNP